MCTRIPTDRNVSRISAELDLVRRVIHALTVSDDQVDLTPVVNDVGDAAAITSGVDRLQLVVVVVCSRIPAHCTACRSRLEYRR